MTASVRILTTRTIDSSPAILLVDPAGNKTLVNCGEGCQRSFLEFSQKISSIRRLCLTHLSCDSIGGLPGMILTSSDISIERQVQEQIAKQNKLQKQQQQQQQSSSQTTATIVAAAGDEEEEESSSSLTTMGLELFGPKGTQTYINSLRHFVRNREDQFPIKIKEGSYHQEPVTNHDLFLAKKYNNHKNNNNNNNNNNKTKKKKKKRKRQEEDDDDDDEEQQQGQQQQAPPTPPPKSYFGVQTIPITYSIPNNNNNNNNSNDENSRIRRPWWEQHQQQQQQNQVMTTVQSYLFTTPTITGKFLPDKAKELGVPKGPLYAQLKAGNSVTFDVDVVDNDDDDDDDETTKTATATKTKTVHSSQVVMESTPGMIIAILYYPTIQVWKALRPRLDEILTTPTTTKTSNNNNNNNRLELVIHMTTNEIFQHDESCKEWRRTTQQQQQQQQHEIQHVFLETSDPAIWKPPSICRPSPYITGCIGALVRSQLSSTLYKTPHYLLSTTTPSSSSTKQEEGERQQEEQRAVEDINTRIATPLMEYVLLPLGKKGFSKEEDSSSSSLLSSVPFQQEKRRAEGMERLTTRGALAEAQRILATATATGNEAEGVHPSSTSTTTHYDGTNTEQQQQQQQQAELFFTGTGSAVPCKHRNVTGMCLRNENGYSILLDVGEGTVGQLLRGQTNSTTTTTTTTNNNNNSAGGAGTATAQLSLPIREPDEILCNIKAVWVSHPHADHHLGLLRLLIDRRAAVLERRRKAAAATATAGKAKHDHDNDDDDDDPVLVIGPPPILEFLREYEWVDPRIASSYIPLDCRQLLINPHRGGGTMLPRVVRENSFFGGNHIEAIQVTHCPYSYAVVLDGTSFGRVAWSGDCRPSKIFAERARGADLLIHEATFEVGMEAVAAMKRHSTVGEALDVARDMKAKRLVLTHFSQRYPKVPPLAIGYGDSVQVIFAFDYMGLTPNNLDVASKLTPALRRLYPEEEEESTAAENQGVAAMSIPGFFAKNPY